MCRVCSIRPSPPSATMTSAVVRLGVAVARGEPRVARSARLGRRAGDEGDALVAMAVATLGHGGSDVAGRRARGAGG